MEIIYVKTKNSMKPLNICKMHYTRRTTTRDHMFESSFMSPSVACLHVVDHEATHDQNLKKTKLQYKKLLK
jgi:hypothetical protein